VAKRRSFSPAHEASMSLRMSKASDCSAADGVSSAARTPILRNATRMRSATVVIV
jgi:hypothetical protein